MSEDEKLNLSHTIDELLLDIKGINETANYFIACLSSQKLKLYAFHDHFTTYPYPNKPPILERKRVYDRFHSLIGYESNANKPKHISIHLMHHIVSYENMLYESESMLENVKQVYHCQFPLAC